MPEYQRCFLSVHYPRNIWRVQLRVTAWQTPAATSSNKLSGRCIRAAFPPNVRTAVWRRTAGRDGPMQPTFFSPVRPQIEIGSVSLFQLAADRVRTFSHASDSPSSLRTKRSESDLTRSGRSRKAARIIRPAWRSFKFSKQKRRCSHVNCLICRCDRGLAVIIYPLSKLWETKHLAGGLRRQLGMEA